MPNITKRLRIFGRVQGVYYRNWSVKTATAMNLTGWVRNRKDSSVEALVTGPEDIVERFIAECYTGPVAAKVELIQVVTGADENLKTFEKHETH